MRCVSSRLMPLPGSNTLRRSSPESTTTRTPSIVRLVSAMFVASTTLRRPARAGRERRVLLAGRELAVERQHVDVVADARLAQPRLHAPDLARARQERQHVAGRLGERALHGTRSDGVERLALTRARQRRQSLAE